MSGNAAAQLPEKQKTKVPSADLQHPRVSLRLALQRTVVLHIRIGTAHGKGDDQSILGMEQDGW